MEKKYLSETGLSSLLENLAEKVNAQGQEIYGSLSNQINNINIPVCSSTTDGIVPMADASAGTISSSSSDWVLTRKSTGVIDWYKLPSAAFSNTNTITNYYYGTCDNAATDVNKVVSVVHCPNIVTVGTPIYVTFTNGNNVAISSIQINYNSSAYITGQIYYKNALLTQADSVWEPGTVISLVMVGRARFDVVGILGGGLSDIPEDIAISSIEPFWVDTSSNNYVYFKPGVVNGITYSTYYDFMYSRGITDSESKYKHGLRIGPSINNNVLTNRTTDGLLDMQILPPQDGHMHIGDYSSLSSTSFYGTLYGNVIGNVTGDVTGNASSATTSNNVKLIGVSTSGYYPMVFTKQFNTSTSSAIDASMCVDNNISSSSSTASGIRYNPSANTCYCSGGFYEASDERFKNFYNDIEVDLDRLSSLPKKYFTWKDKEDEKMQIGTSAQELQKIYPELVDNVNGTLSVSYDKLSIIALKGIDILNDKVKSLEERLEKLEKIVK